MTRQSETAESEAIASIPRAVRTVNLSVVISLVSLVMSLFTLIWNVRPARIEPVMSAVFASQEGGLHISVPLSIVNRGATSAAVLAAKLYESGAGGQALLDAEFTTDPTRAIPAMTGSLNQTNVALWVPIVIPANGQVERVFIFKPQHEGSDPRIVSGQRVSYKVVLLLSGDKEVETSTDVLWPKETNGIMSRGKGGVGVMGAELDRWFSEVPASSQ